MFANRRGASEEAFLLRLAEIVAFEQFGRQDDLRAVLRRLSHEDRDGLDIGINVIRQSELEGGNVHVLILKPDAKTRGDADRDEIEQECQDATRRQCDPEIDALPQHHRHQKEHRQ